MTNYSDDMDKDIREMSSGFQRDSRDRLDEMMETYWEVSKQVSEGQFKSRLGQIKAINKLSQLGIALHATSEAVKALDAVRLT